MLYFGLGLVVATELVAWIKTVRLLWPSIFLLFAQLSQHRHARDDESELYDWQLVVVVAAGIHRLGFTFSYRFAALGAVSLLVGFFRFHSQTLRPACCSFS